MSACVNAGGKDQFNWDNVKADKEREYYLGHSVKALTGRCAVRAGMARSCSLASHLPVAGTDLSGSQPCLTTLLLQSALETHRNKQKHVGTDTGPAGTKCRSEKPYFTFIHFNSLVCVGVQVAEGQGCVLVHSGRGPQRCRQGGRAGHGEAAGAGPDDGGEHGRCFLCVGCCCLSVCCLQSA